jgi:uncharacterized membrane protein (UPF0127 family)
MEEGIIHIADNVFPTLLAISEEEQTKGLMYVAWPPPVMSFIYSVSGVNRFWMSKTPSPLDIVFCNNGKVTQIHKGNPYSTEMIGDSSMSDLIIEFPLGTARKSEIKIGSDVGLVKPTLLELRQIFAKR